MNVQWIHQIDTIKSLCIQLPINALEQSLPRTEALFDGAASSAIWRNLPSLVSHSWTIELSRLSWISSRYWMAFRYQKDDPSFIQRAESMTFKLWDWRADVVVVVSGSLLSRFCPTLLNSSWSQGITLYFQAAPHFFHFITHIQGRILVPSIRWLVADSPHLRISSSCFSTLSVTTANWLAPCTVGNVPRKALLMWDNLPFQNYPGFIREWKTLN